MISTYGYLYLAYLSFVGAPRKSSEEQNVFRIGTLSDEICCTIEWFILDFMSEINPCVMSTGAASSSVFSISVIPVVSTLFHSWNCSSWYQYNIFICLLIFIFHQRCNEMRRKLDQQAWYVTISICNKRM